MSLEKQDHPPSSFFSRIVGVLENVSKVKLYWKIGFEKEFSEHSKKKAYFEFKIGSD